MSELEQGDVEPYLWTGAGEHGEHGELDELVMRVEGELGTLRWRPRALPSAGAELVLPPRELARGVEGSAARARGGELISGPTRWWPALVTGLAAAAAVFALLAWLRPLPSPRSVPGLSPAGSPELRDPFDSGEQRGRVAPPDERARDQRGAPRVSPELTDPFKDPSARERGDTEGAPERREQARPRRVSPDLKDPFAPDASDAGAKERREVSKKLRDPYGDEPASPTHNGPALVDPFTGERREVDPRSPDLKDPFTRGD